MVEESTSNHMEKAEKGRQDEKKDEIILPQPFIRWRKLVTAAVIVVSGPVLDEENGQVLEEAVV